MEKKDSSCSILRSLNLDNIEEVLSEAYHKEGAGRPPRRPIGIFKALIVKRVKQVPSDQELYRRLWHDEDLREVCNIEENQKPYHPSQLTRFRKRLGSQRLQRIMDMLLDELKKHELIAERKVVLDATFIKAYSKLVFKTIAMEVLTQRQELATYELGYKLHLAVDAKSELPLAIIVAPANDNEKKHAQVLFNKALKATNGRVKIVIADSVFQREREEHYILSERQGSNSVSNKSVERAEKGVEG